jgi:hypothetical protein
MGDISVEANEKPSDVYTTRKSTLIGYVFGVSCPTQCQRYADFCISLGVE